MSKFSVIALIVALLPFGSAQAVAKSAASRADTYISLEELRAKYGDAQSKYATIGGIEVHYKDEGSGPAILMVHGSSSTLKTYDIEAAILTSHYRVVRYDIPPQGLSGPVSDEVLKHVQSTDIPAGLLQQLGIKNATCVGVSSGGTMCIYLAARHPDLVGRLILSNSPSDPVEGARPQTSKALAEANRKARETGLKSRAYWDAMMDNFTGEPERVTPQIREQYYDVNRRPPDKNILGLDAIVANHAVALDLMGKVKVPTLLVWGARDPLLTPPTMDILAGYLKNATVSKLLLPDVGHYPPLEVPVRYAQIVAAYIEAVTPVQPKSPDPKDR